MNLRLGRISRLLAPRYSWCLRCKTSWKFVQKHITDYRASGIYAKGCFPLCEKCWAQLSPDQRLPFYRELVVTWSHDACYSDEYFNNTWRDIKKAVLAGL